MGRSIAEVLGKLQVNIDESESRVTSGTVESVTPLLIKKDKLLITEDYIVRSSPVDYIGLEVGQEVILLQSNRQQTYYILDIPEESFSDKILKDIDDRIKEIEDIIEFPPVWTIGEDGYWYKDGVKTDTKATGEDGVNGDVWDISGDGYWIKNGIKTDIKAEGEVGRGIREIKEYFAVNNNHLVAPSTGWLEQPVSTSNSNRYLWNYEEIILTDDEILTTTKRVISVHGADGIGISSIKNYYLAYPLSGGVTVSTDGWTETIQVPDSVNKYLWNYEIVFHTDGSQSETIPIVIGNYAKDGDELYTWIKYADTPDSGMSDDPTGKEYMGVAYNKPTDEESEVYSDYRWAKIAGEDGEDGRGIVEVVSYYAINNSEIPPDYESFSTTILVPTKFKKYLWGYEKTTYTSAPLTEDTERRVISVYGDKGADGISIISAKRQFYLSTSNTTQTDGSWSDTQPAWESGKHLWTRLLTTYSDESTQATGVALDKDWIALTDMNIELGKISSDGYITKAGRTQLVIKVKSMESDYAGLEEYLGLWAGYETAYNDTKSYLEDIISAENDIVQVDPAGFKGKIKDYEEALVEMKRLVREHESQRIFELESRLSSAELEITDESILQKITSSEVFVSKEAYDDDTGAVQDRLTYLENTTSTFETTIDGWEARVTTEIEDALGVFEDEFHDYIRWADGKLYLGKSTSEISLVQQHDRISFMQGDFELAYFSDGQLVVNEIMTKILNIQGYSIKAVGDDLEGWYYG